MNPAFKTSNNDQIVDKVERKKYNVFVISEWRNYRSYLINGGHDEGQSASRLIINCRN